ncbi:MAG: hypothetical protein ABIQ73_14420 [Acidimicrobiales bacterium]
MSVLHRKAQERPLDIDQQRALSRTLASRPERAFDAGFVIGAAVVLCSAIVILQNNKESATLDVLWWTWNTRLWLVVASAGAVGAAIGLSLPRAVRRRRAMAQERAALRRSIQL